MDNEQKKIKVAFPHMGTIYVAWAAALKKWVLNPTSRRIQAKEHFH